jgi:L-ribulokinase
MIVAGIDFGTQSVRVTLLDTLNGSVLASASESYDVQRSAEDPLRATQSHADQMQALKNAISKASAASGALASEIGSLGCATTGSSVIFTDDHLQPVSDYYLWCDHRAYKEAAEITRSAREQSIEALKWCGGTYSHEWGYAKLLHFLRSGSEESRRATLAIENCDMIAATLCGVQNPSDLKRSVCAMGHKWMWGESWGGYPPDRFFASIDPLLADASSYLRGTVVEQGGTAGHLSPAMADFFGLSAGIPVAVGAFDAHWDAVGTGARPGDMVNIIGTSTCMIGVLDGTAQPVSGICGTVQGSVWPGLPGVEAGLSAVGDAFNAVAQRCNTTVEVLSDKLSQRARQMTGLLRIPWDNGDRTILVQAELGAILLGLDLSHRAEDELQAAIEGTALHTRLILSHIDSQMGAFECVINGGGIPPKNPFLNQIYADTLGREILVPQSPVTGIGPGIFAAVAAGAFETIQEAQSAFCPQFHSIEPDSKFTGFYEDLYAKFSEIYHSFGDESAGHHAETLRLLKRQRTGSL